MLRILLEAGVASQRSPGRMAGRKTAVGA